MFPLEFFSCLLLYAGVQSAAVNVICELARKNPKNYLSLAPIFFKLMTTSTNNWMLIKIIKLVSSIKRTTNTSLILALNFSIIFFSLVP